MLGKEYRIDTRSYKRQMTGVRDMYRNCTVPAAYHHHTESLVVAYVFYVPSTCLLELRTQCLIFVSKRVCLFMVFGVLLQYNIIHYYLYAGVTDTRPIKYSIM